MADSFVEVARKIERADEHVKDLVAELERFQQTKREAVVREDDPSDPDYVRWVLPDASVDDKVRLILGDAIHNLRSALDYVVDLLVRANGSIPSTKTAFPIWRRGGVPNRQQYESLVSGKVYGAASGRRQRLLRVGAVRGREARASLGLGLSRHHGQTPAAARGR